MKEGILIGLLALFLTGCGSGEYIKPYTDKINEYVDPYRTPEDGIDSPEFQPEN